MQQPNRRAFLKSSVLAAGVSSMALPALGQANPSDKIRVAVVGLGGRGRFSHCGALRQMKKDNVEIAALCDCDENRANAAAAENEKEAGNKPLIYKDYRKLLEDKSIDAVSLATPNHWHALQAIWACQAGKDVYTEKPASHNIREGRMMVDAARKYKRIVQHGTQCRTSPKIIEGMQKLKEGAIGRVYMARGIAFKHRAGGKNEIGPVPQGMDWDAWLGPAPEAPYNKLAVYRWRFIYAYGNGEIGDQGVHQLDMIRWGCGLDTHPVKIQCLGNKAFNPGSDTDSAGCQIFSCQYEDRDFIVQFETRDGFTNPEAGMGTKYPFVDHQNVCGVIFFGTEGYMIIPDYSSYHTFLGQKREPGPHASVEGAPMMDLDAFQNWIAAARSRRHEDLLADIEEGHRSATLAHLANIAYWTGRTLEFDPKTERFKNDDEANRFLTRDYRSPYLLPESV